MLIRKWNINHITFDLYKLEGNIFFAWFERIQSLWCVSDKSGLSVTKKSNQGLSDIGDGPLTSVCRGTVGVIDNPITD